MLWRLRRTARRKLAETIYAVDRDDLAEAFAAIGLRRGATVCVHSALSQIGYLEGGQEALIETLMETVGEEGTILMPSYPSLGAIADYLDGGPVFDVRNTPSKVGSLTEKFRRMPGATRSLHPTNPVAGWGRHAERLLAGHEDSPTPYGDETPYGRLARMEDAYILMIETPILSLLHHLQERVDFPNYLLPGERRAEIIDWEGRRRTVTTRVLRPRLPYWIAIAPQDASAEVDWIVLHDFALILTRSREREIRAMGYRLGGYPKALERRSRLVEAGHLGLADLGKGQIGLLRVKPFLEAVIPELAGQIERFRPCYDLDRLERTALPAYS